MNGTIERLEGENWGDPESAGWPLVGKCLRLRRVPIDQFSAEDLHLMIGQDIGTKHLMHRTLNILESNPLAEGNCYPGDLLGDVIKLSDEYWRDNSDQLDRMIEIARRGLGMTATDRHPFFDRKLRGELLSFIWRHERADNHQPHSVNYEQYHDYGNAFNRT